MKSQTPLISIVTPLYNAEKYVEETINSVLKQTYPHWEMVIVDDGSTDNSFQIASTYKEKDSRISIYKRNRLPKGVSTSRNIGIEKSNGDYILFLDADDLLFPICLENRLKVMNEEGNPDFCVFQMNMLSSEKEFDGRLLTHQSENYLYDFISYKLPWTVTSPLWNAKFLKERLIGFDESFTRLEDPELHIRALLEKDVRYKVFYEANSLDCSYRFFSGKIKLTPALNSFSQYIQAIYDKVAHREDKQIYFSALHDLYDQIILFYTTFPADEMKSNAKELKSINRLFLSKDIVNNKEYKKTNLFISYIKFGLYKYQTINGALLKVGFDHFYAFRIPTSKSATK